MKTAIFGICFLALLRSLSIGQTTADIPATNRVILKGFDWKPSEGETEQALASIQRFLELHSLQEKTDPEIKFILNHLKSYRVQFLGLKNEAKKVILCNFFPIPRGGRDHFGYWRERKVEAFDFGAWFWHINYDPSTGQCFDFAPDRGY